MVWPPCPFFTVCRVLCAVSTPCTVCRVLYCVLCTVPRRRQLRKMLPRRRQLPMRQFRRRPPRRRQLYGGLYTEYCKLCTGIKPHTCVMYCRPTYVYGAAKAVPQYAHEDHITHNVPTHIGEKVGLRKHRSLYSIRLILCLWRLPRGWLTTSTNP